MDDGPVTYCEYGAWLGLSSAPSPTPTQNECCEVIGNDTRNWDTGNITLIGDAIHPFLPNLGQGACQALEDAHFIAKGVHVGMTGPVLTQWFTQTRRKRVSIMQRDSRETRALGQGKGMFYHFARGLFGKPPFDGIMRKQLTSQFGNSNRPHH